MDTVSRATLQAPSGPRGTISDVSIGIGAAVVLLVLFLLVVLAAASFFRHMLASSLVLLAIPVVVLLDAGIGTVNSAFAIAAVVILVALIQTITGSLKLLRAASTAPPRRPHAIPSRHRTSTRRSNRSRIAA